MLREYNRRHPVGLSLGCSFVRYRDRNDTSPRRRRAATRSPSDLMHRAWTIRDQRLSNLGGVERLRPRRPASGRCASRSVRSRLGSVDCNSGIWRAGRPVGYPALTKSGAGGGTSLPKGRCCRLWPSRSQFITTVRNNSRTSNTARNTYHHDISYV